MVARAVEVWVGMKEVTEGPAAAGRNGTRGLLKPGVEGDVALGRCSRASRRWTRPSMKVWSVALCATTSFS
jgi:hypothetical protein